MENDLASDIEISVESDEVGAGEIEIKSDKAIVKPPIEVMVISPDTNQVANLKRIWDTMYAISMLLLFDFLSALKASLTIITWGLSTQKWEIAQGFYALDDTKVIT